MSYFFKVTEPEKATEQLKSSYAILESMFLVVPKVFVAQSLRPDLLEPMVTYVKRLMVETHALPRRTKELIAAYVSKVNACAYWVDAHSAMAMAQGLTREEVQSILDDIDGTSLIDAKTKALLHLSEKITRESHKIHEGTMQELRKQGCSDEELFEVVAVASLFNFMDRMADALGAPVEGFQDMIAEMEN